MTAAAAPVVRRATGDTVDAATLYALLLLRVDVFVVEQRVAYRELDGADVRADTIHLWIDGERPAGSDAGMPSPVCATARLRVRADGHELGRVAVARAERGRGLGAAVVCAGLETAGRPLHCNAQAHLEDWYARLGFATVGPAFEWDGIPHVPMRRDR